jgi:hypothetical protein
MNATWLAEISRVVRGLRPAAVLLVVIQGFTLGAGTLAATGAAVVLVVTAAMLLSIHVSVAGVIRRAPSIALQYA